MGIDAHTSLIIITVSTVIDTHCGTIVVVIVVVAVMMKNLVLLGIETIIHYTA